MNPHARRMAKLAGDRILNSGREACERMEREALAALKKAEWDRARLLFRRRLEVRHRPDAPEVAAIDRLLRLIDEAEANGVGPDPA